MGDVQGSASFLHVKNASRLERFSCQIPVSMLEFAREKRLCCERDNCCVEFPSLAGKQTEGSEAIQEGLNEQSKKSVRGEKGQFCGCG